MQFGTIWFLLFVFWRCLPSRCYEISKEILMEICKKVLDNINYFGVAVDFTLSYLECLEYSAARCFNALPLIVGGLPVENHEFPHMALIGFGIENISWQCGGTLISENFVLSAAHCASSSEHGAASKVMLGMLHRNDSAKYVQRRNINEIIKHPDYTRSEKYHDIVLFRLDFSVVFTAHVAPACLNVNGNLHYDRWILTATGFGKRTFDDDKGSDNLYKVNLPVLKNSICKPFYGTMKNRGLRRGLINEQLCAGFLKGGRDTCLGDSGGPLQIYDEELCNFVIVGITSFGKFCGFPKSPAIYTNVYSYVPWIEGVVWSEDEEMLL